MLLRGPWRTAIRASALLLAWVVARPVGPLSSQETRLGPVRLGSVSGDLGAEYRSSVWLTPSTLDLWDNGFREWAYLRLPGSLFHPQILGFRLGVQPTFTQWRYSGEDPTGYRTGNRLNGDVQVYLLRALPVWASFGAVRMDQHAPSRQGLVADLDRAGWNAGIHVRSPVLPMEARYEDLEWRTRWSGPLDYMPRDEHIRDRRFLYEARNSKTTLRYDRLDRNDLLTEADFVRTLATFRHRLRWGRGSQLSSHLERRSRVGFAPQKRDAWTESLALTHNPRVLSRSSVAAAWTERNGFSSRSVEGRATLIGLPTPSLEVDLDWQSLWRSSAFGRNDYHRVGPRARWHRDPSPLWSLSASGGLFYESRIVESVGDGFVDVVDERYRIPESLRFSLRLPGVVPGSVVISTPLDSRILQEGIDYALVVEGHALAVQILPGSGLGAGDDLLVSYRAVLSPSQTASGPAFEYGLQARFGYLTLEHRRSHRIGLGLTTVPFGDSPTETWDEQILALRATIPAGPATASGSLERKWRDFFGDYSVIDQGSFRLAMLLPRGLGATASGHFLSADRFGGRYTSRQGEAALEWRATPGWTLTGGMSYWRWKEGPTSAGFLSPTAELRVLWRAMEVRARYGLYRLDSWGSPTRREERVYVSVVRRFR